MTNEELLAKIKARIERLKYVIEPMFLKGDDSYYEGENDGYNRILSFISTLESEKPVSVDLEEAAKKFVGYDMDCDEQRDYEIGIASFIAGYNLCKEQMMKEAVEADVNIYRDLAGGESWAEFVVAKPPKNLGDKVRIIILRP